MGHRRITHAAQKGLRCNETTVPSAPSRHLSAAALERQHAHGQEDKPRSCPVSAARVCRRGSHEARAPCLHLEEPSENNSSSLPHGSREHNQKWYVPWCFNPNRMLFLNVAAVLASILLQTKWNYYDKNPNHYQTKAIGRKKRADHQTIWTQFNVFKRCLRAAASREGSLSKQMNSPPLLWAGSKPTTAGFLSQLSPGQSSPQPRGWFKRLIARACHTKVWAQGDRSWRAPPVSLGLHWERAFLPTSPRSGTAGCSSCIPAFTSTGPRRSHNVVGIQYLPEKERFPPVQG